MILFSFLVHLSVSTWTGPFLSILMYLIFIHYPRFCPDFLYVAVAEFMISTSGSIARLIVLVFVAPDQVVQYARNRQEKRLEFGTGGGYS